MKRLLCVLLCALVVFALSIPCLAEDMSLVGTEVVSNQGDYFLYGILIFAAVIGLGLVIFFFIKSR